MGDAQIGRRRRSRLLLASLAGLAALAGANRLAAKAAERRHPPRGRFIDVEGVRLHYTDRGSGPTILLIHGNAVSGEDWHSSGVAEMLERNHRVIVFDRPGFGHSARPAGRIWSAEAQADLIHAAMDRLGARHPIIAGHSFGAIVALAYAIRHDSDVAGLVLVSGYYFWTLRPDVLLVGPVALPGLGHLIAHTISPFVGWLQTPLLHRLLFWPAPVPSSFKANYSTGMAVRPSQARATAVDGALMVPEVVRLRASYAALRVPVAIVAGAGDRIVFSRMAQRLCAVIPGSTLKLVRRAGHMVHHTAPNVVAHAIASQARVALS